MREIKFRAWDGKNMIYDVGVSKGKALTWKSAPKNSATFTAVIDGKTHYGYSDWDVRLERPDYKLMQFTGFRDQEGNEIYEGDIVFVRRAKEHRIVVFREGAFCVVSGNDHFPLNQTRVDGLDVVGNCYQNPELLEASC